MKLTNNLELNYNQMILANIEKLASLPTFTAQDESRPIFITDSGSPNFGLNIGKNGAWETIGGGSLSGLSDVVIDTPTDGQIISYNSGTWENIDNALDNLSDVDIDTPTDGQVLTYNSGQWVNSVGGGGGGGGSFELEEVTVSALNTVDDLSIAPSDETKSMLFLNGQLRRYGVDYTISGVSISWISPVDIDTPDIIIVFYPVGGGGDSPFFEFFDIASLVNPVATLSGTPSDPLKVLVFLNGQLRRITDEYNISGQDLNYVGITPALEIGDTLGVFYLGT